MSNRKYVSIERVTSKELVVTRKGNSIYKITALGFTSIVAEPEFTDSPEINVGDLIVLFEPDVILPNTPQFEFMYANKNNGVVRLRKMYGVNVDSLMLSAKQLYFNVDSLIPSVKQLYLASLEEGCSTINGMSILEYLGCSIKLEEEKIKELQVAGIGEFPSFLHKTDETRYQSVNMRNFKEGLYDVTEKLDGTSVTYYFDQNGDLHMFSRNKKVPIYTDTDECFSSCYSSAFLTGFDKNRCGLTISDPDSNGKVSINSSIFKNLAFQGEIIGEGIQGNKYQLHGVKFYCFYIFDAVKLEYTNLHSLLMYNVLYGIQNIPHFGTCYNLSKENFTNEINEIREIYESLSSKVTEGIKMEGIVLSAMSRSKQKDSFKIIFE